MVAESPPVLCGPEPRSWHGAAERLRRELEGAREVVVGLERAAEAKGSVGAEASSAFRLHRVIASGLTRLEELAVAWTWLRRCESSRCGAALRRVEAERRCRPPWSQVSDWDSEDNLHLFCS